MILEALENGVFFKYKSSLTKFKFPRDLIFVPPKLKPPLPPTYVRFPRDWIGDLDNLTLPLTFVKFPKERSEECPALRLPHISTTEPRVSTSILSVKSTVPTRI